MSSYRAIPCDKCCNGFYEGPGYGLTVCVYCDGTGRIVVPERRDSKTPTQRWCFRWGAACLIFALFVLLIWKVLP